MGTSAAGGSGKPGPAIVDVWIIPLDRPDAEVARLAEALNEVERARAARFVAERDRRRFRVARGALRRILARYEACRPAELELTTESYGKPRLAAASVSGSVEFNLTHSGEIALLAVTAGRCVGIDVEQRREVPEYERIAARMFSKAERQGLMELSEPERAAAFLRVWTRKEAYLKAVGTGLFTPLDRFTVPVGATAMPSVGVMDVVPDPERGWTIGDFDPVADYVGAIVVESGEWSARAVTFELD